MDGHWQKFASGGERIEAVGPAGPNGGIAITADGHLYSTGTVQLTGSGVVLVSTNGQTITISAPVQTVQTQNVHNVTISGNTSGALAAISSGTMTLAGGNNITLSQAGNAVTISAANSAAQTNQSMGVYGSSQTTGASSSSTIDARSISIVGAGGVSVGLTGGSIIISGAAGGGAGSQSVGMSNLGNTSGTTGIASGSAVRLLLAGGNNVTLSQSVNGASATITISGPNTVAQSVQSIGVYGSSQTTAGTSSGTADARSLSIRGMGAISVGFSASEIILSAPATIAQSVQTQNLVDVTLAGNTSGALALVSSGTLTLAGGNNVTLSQAGNAVTISVGGGAESVQTLGIYGSSQTTGASSSNTYDARSLSIVGAGANSIGWTNGSLIISAPNTVAQTAQTLGVYASSQTTGQSSSNTVDARSVSLVGQGIVSVGLSGNSVLISATTAAQTVESQSFGMSNLGNTSGTTGIASGGQVRFILAGTNNVTLSQSVNGASGTISISAPDPFVAGVSNLGNTAGSTGVTGTRVVLAATNGMTLSQSTDAAGATVTILPVMLSSSMVNSAIIHSFGAGTNANTTGTVNLFEIPNNISMSRIDVLMTVSCGTSATTNTGANAQSWVWGLYTRSVSTLSPLSAGSSSTTWSWASNTGVYSSLTGQRMVSFAMATALTPGDYYFMVQQSSATSSIGASTSSLGMTMAPIFGLAAANMSVIAMNAASASSINDLQPLQGLKVAHAITHTSMTMQQSDIRATGAENQRANILYVLRNV